MLNTDTKNYMTIQWNGGLRYYKEDSQSYNNMIELIESNKIAPNNIRDAINRGESEEARLL